MDEGSIAGSASDFLLVSNYAQAISEEFKIIAEILQRARILTSSSVSLCLQETLLKHLSPKSRTLPSAPEKNSKDSIKEIINTSTEALRENLVSALKKAANTLLKFVAKIFESIFHLCSLGP